MEHFIIRRTPLFLLAFTYFGYEKKLKINLMHQIHRLITVAQLRRSFGFTPHHPAAPPHIPRLTASRL